MNTIDTISEKNGMKINIKKTKIMKISRKGGKMEIKIRGIALEQVEGFCYLGSMITEDAKSNKEIKKENRNGERRLYKA